ncbi:hypothetical protein DITRI_Ditri20bG0007500 [Diplodiscus trichospermus]
MADNLFAAIDMGTNAFKLLIVQAYPPGKFVPLLTVKEPVVLGRESSSSSISAHSQNLSVKSLEKFNKLIQTHRVSSLHTRCVATSAVREARNRAQFIDSVSETTGFEVEVLSGEEEARFSYLGALQFLPVFEKLVLNVDIGGGSTEFTIGSRGNVDFCLSLQLGHVTLTQQNFGDEEAERVLNMREYVRKVIKESGLLEKVKNFGFEVAVGSSGTIRAIDKAVFKGYGLDFADNEALFRECKRDWRFSREELKSVVERLCKRGEGQKVRRDGFFKKRSESIVAGGILLEEIFDLLGIKEMLVSGYGLREGVIADTLAKVFDDGYDLNANARFRSLLRLATRFNGKKKNTSAAEMASIAREIFEGLRRSKELGNDGVKLTVPIDGKGLEYLEAACLLHNIGLFTGKKGYHKQSYHIIMNGNQLHGYSAEEVKFIALLTRHHRKKLPKFDDASFNEFGEEAKLKFRVLCAIIRLSVVLHRNGYISYREMDFSHSHEGFKLVIGEGRDSLLPGVEQRTAANFEIELRHELEYFKKLYQIAAHNSKADSLPVVVPAATSIKTGLVSAVAQEYQSKSKLSHNPGFKYCWLYLFEMGFKEKAITLQVKEEKACKTKAVCVHAFTDLTYVSPVVFLYLLKECYVHGNMKATKKFRALQQEVHQVLCNSPQPGPASFVAYCLYVLPIFGTYCEGFSHLIISALHRFLKTTATTGDSLEAKRIAARLFLNIVEGAIDHDERIAVKVLEVFDIRLIDIEKVVSQLKAQNDFRFDNAKTFIERYIFGFIESQSYMTAVNLLEHFSIRQSGRSFLVKMMENKQFRAAEKWAMFMGNPMLSILVQEYANRNMLKNAYLIVKKNNLQQEFPDVQHKYKESALKKLAEKACWDVAEAKANGDRRLVEYLVYLAMEAGYLEKVDELCNRYSLEGFLKAEELEASFLHFRFLNLNDLAVEDIIWVDELNGLHEAACNIERSKVVGLDCEWKPNYVKGSKPNKVSIMQIASDKMVFVFDLIKLYEDVPGVLDDCLTRVLHSPRILKLGYNFQCDVKQLAQSYGDLECFKCYNMLLDIQNMFKEPRGGLSGLAEKILGAGLNKTRRNSNWEQRPLTRNQLEYAALDAAVLIQIFYRLRDHSHPVGVLDGNDKIEWKSHIVSHMDNPKKSTKGSRTRTASEVEDDEP